MLWRPNFAWLLGSLRVHPGGWELLELRKISYGQEPTLQSSGKARVLDFFFYKEYWAITMYHVRWVFD